VALLPVPLLWRRRAPFAVLMLSGHTVKTHVGNVLAKLHLRDRIHAVVYAYESGLIQPGR
jgi:DNA-binding CsgD family transcriptional regulator